MTGRKATLLRDLEVRLELCPDLREAIDSAKTTPDLAARVVQPLLQSALIAGDRSAIAAVGAVGNIWKTADDKDKITKENQNNPPKQVNFDFKSNTGSVRFKVNMRDDPAGKSNEIRVGISVNYTRTFGSNGSLFEKQSVSAKLTIRLKN